MSKCETCKFYTTTIEPILNGTPGRVDHCKNWDKPETCGKYKKSIKERILEKIRK